MLSSVQFVEKVYKAFRAKPDFNKNLKNPETCVAVLTTGSAKRK